MEEVLLCAVFSASNILCFIYGARIGQNVSRGEEVKLPEVHPIRAVHEHQERREAERRRSKVDAILRNIDRYDGTEAGQEDVPGGW